MIPVVSEAVAHDGSATGQTIWVLASMEQVATILADPEVGFILFGLNYDMISNAFFRNSWEAHQKVWLFPAIPWRRIWIYG